MTRDGGSAFPAVLPGHVYGDGSRTPPEIASYGMTLRDYFAAAAMTGLVAADTGYNAVYNGLARSAYQMADAMLAARTEVAA